jgi:hypothetical protein
MPDFGSTDALDLIAEVAPVTPLIPELLSTPV